MITPNRIISNLKYVAFSDVLCRAIGFITVILLARYLGPEDYGKYALILSFAYIFIIFANFGIDTLTIKDVSKDKSLAEKYSALHFLLKPSLSLISIILLNFIFFGLGYPKEIAICMAIFSVHIVFYTLSEAISSIFKAYERMEYSSLVMLINSFAGLIFIIILVSLKGNLTEIIISRVLAFLIGFIVALIILFRQFIEPNFSSLNYQEIKKMLFSALPFLTIGIVYTLYYKVDIIMLSKIKGEVYVGWYAVAANDLFFALFIIPRTITTVIFPNFSRTFKESFQLFKHRVNFTLKIMISLGVPISIGTVILAPKIINLAFGSEYENSVIVLRIISIGVIAVFLRDVLGYALVSAEKVSFVMAMNIGALVLNIILNIIFIPLFAHIGAALTSTICLITSLFIAYHFFKYKVGEIQISQHLSKSFLAGIVMSIPLYLLYHFNIFLLIIIGSIVYIPVLFLLRIFNDSELLILKEAIIKK